MGYLIAILAVLTAFGGYTAYERNQAATAAVAKLEVQQAEAARQAQDAIDAAVSAAGDKITDMDAAFEVGEANAKTITQKIYVQGQANVAKDSGLNNAVCVMSPDSLQLLRSALNGMRGPTDPGEVPAAVPGPGIAGERDIRSALPQQPQEHGPVGPMHPDARPAGGDGRVPGLGVPSGARPKPKPIR